jgi:NAD(P)-dependent dehydrogenase (short-subunit alcohol dehydrogenase family)
MWDRGGGAGYVSDQPLERQKMLCSNDITWEQIQDLYDHGLESCKRGGYGLSKALVHSYTMLLAREYPDVMCFCLSPGWVQTAMTAGTSAKLTPEEATKSLLHSIFEATPEQSGWFYGSDAQRSPLHKMRNPGQPVFDGVYPWEKDPEMGSVE